MLLPTTIYVLSVQLNIWACDVELYWLLLKLIDVCAIGIGPVLYLQAIDSAAVVCLLGPDRLSLHFKWRLKFF